jgi:alkanesulfonate monooxygenase SsuD/methylene tetrahydromethanopterin reductase-like flavin-dependent oxidoreductase (luciferase family)
VRLGATLAHLSDAPPFAVAAWADRLVTAGFESLWTPHIIGRGSLIPDPFVTLATAASVTQDVELGTATVQVPLYHPADLAHRVLSLMSVCGDRLTLGVSPGSTETDFATLDRDYTARFATFHRNTGRLRVLLAHGRDEHADLTSAAVVGPPARLVGRQCRAGSAGFRRLAGLRIPPHARSDHRCPRALPGGRRPAGDRVRDPAGQQGRPRADRRGTPPLRPRRLR